jgi:hypothetical protein
MKSLLIFTFLLPHAMFADWVLVQKTSVEGSSGTQEMTIKLKGEKARMDLGTQMTLLSDSTNGEMKMYLHAQKMAVNLNADTMKSAMALAGQFLGKNDEKIAKPEATGQKEKVSGYDAEIYHWKGKLGTGRFWVTADFPAYKEINALQDKMAKGMGNPAANLAPQASDFPGMVVKSEMEMLGKKTTTELVSVKQEPVSDEAFKAPEGYQEMKLPGLPGK